MPETWIFLNTLFIKTKDIHSSTWICLTLYNGFKILHFRVGEFPAWESSHALHTEGLTVKHWEMAGMMWHSYKPNANCSKISRRNVLFFFSLLQIELYFSTYVFFVVQIWTSKMFETHSVSSDILVIFHTIYVQTYKLLNWTEWSIYLPKRTITMTPNKWTEQLSFC